VVESDFTITPRGWDLQLVGAPERKGKKELFFLLLYFLFFSFLLRSKDCFASFDLGKGSTADPEYYLDSPV